MDKTCSEIRELIALGGETADNERIAVESHVSICADCARELAETRTLIGNLGILREGEMPAGASERIWQGVRYAVPGSRRPLILAWSLRAAAVLVFGVSIGFTSTSIAGRSAAPGGFAEDRSADEARSTLVTEPYTRGAFEKDRKDKVYPAPPGFPTFQIPTQTWTWHYLPQVDEVLEPEVVRF